MQEASKQAAKLKEDLERNEAESTKAQKIVDAEKKKQQELLANLRKQTTYSLFGGKFTERKAPVAGKEEADQQ